jgi:acetylornithine/succinyldiaminopimelate/putrescine aminotransferase
VVRRVADPGFLADVKAKGEYLHERLEEINSSHIKAVRGRGLMVGVDLDVPVADVTGAGYPRGLLLINAGTHTLRLVPPLIITRDEIDVLVERLSAVLQAM